MGAIAGEERLMPHFHLSAQSGDDMILKRMKRRHARSHTIAFCDEVRRRRPEAAFGADLIAGFPTETEAMFENSLKLVADAGLSSLHVFPFSPRQGTPAAKMPQVPRAIVKERAARLRACGTAALAARHDAMHGQRHTLLVEKSGLPDETCLGRTECFAPVEFSGNVSPGSFVSVNVSGRRGDHLLGELCR
jgi:threonylcarbamoyladenosine tRNA methylthiotransferase MtaB